jgi:hydroxypyruvate reductase
MFERTPRDSDAPLGRVAVDAIEAGIAAAQPDAVLRESVSLDGDTLRVASAEYHLPAYDEVLVLGGGNAAGRAASHLADLLGDRLSGGVVVTDDPAPAGPVETVEGTHPFPSEANVNGTRTLLERAEESGERTLALVPITGGGSALLCAPVRDVSLSELRELTEGLLRSGAPIEQINAVRKHVSSVKGGQLARALAPATAVGLVFSDVTSGDPSVVASGPLSPDETTYRDALDVLAQYDVDAPESVESHLRAGADGDAPETVAADDPVFETVSVFVLADGFTALSAAAETCEREGFPPTILSASVRGEAKEAAKTHVAIAEEIRRTGNPVSPPAAILSGGETTVTIRGSGVGGPNQEFALSAAIELSDDEGVVLAAVDTDGIDGPTEAAGALVTSDTAGDRREARAALSNNDAYDFLGERDALLVSGHTGTNVNDLRVLLVSAPDGE